MAKFNLCSATGLEKSKQIIFCSGVFKNVICVDHLRTNGKRFAAFLFNNMTAGFMDGMLDFFKEVIDCNSIKDKCDREEKFDKLCDKSELIEHDEYICPFIKRDKK